MKTKTKEDIRNIAFTILQKHHDYIKKNYEKHSEYEEEKVLDSMIDFATAYAKQEAEAWDKWILRSNFERTIVNEKLVYYRGSEMYTFDDLYSIFQKERSGE